MVAFARETPPPQRPHRQIVVLSEGIATPFTGNDPATRTFRGCLYRHDGSRLDLSQRSSGPGYQLRPDDPARIDPDAPGIGDPSGIVRLPGRTLYLGHYFAHYGHFLTETLGNFWVLEAEPFARFDRVAFHPSAFGRALTPYARACLAAFGIPETAVVMLDEGPVRFEEVVVPARLFRLWEMADAEALRPVYARIGAHLCGVLSEAPHRALYLTRRRSARRDLRVMANEARIEALFAERGFTILAPETLGFAEQVALYAGTRRMTGVSGSALHNVLFLRPGGDLVEIEHPMLYEKGDRLGVHTQDLCNAVAGVTGHFLPFRGRTLHGGFVAHVDIPALAAALSEIGGPEIGRSEIGSSEGTLPESGVSGDTGPRPVALAASPRSARRHTPLPLGRRLRGRAAVRLEIAGHDLRPLVRRASAGLQHAGRRAASLAFFLLSLSGL